MKVLRDRTHEESEPNGRTANERRAPDQAKQDSQKGAGIDRLCPLIRPLPTMRLILLLKIRIP